MTQDVLKTKKDGFTLVELLITIAIIGVLAGIAIPTTKAYQIKAEYAALQTTLRFLMDSQDIYFVENDIFYPGKGSINIRKGQEKAIPELNYTFPSGHRHRYIIYGSNIKRRYQQINMYYIEVRADFDFNGNGRNDRLRFITLFINGSPIRNRELHQYR
jgi:prepilin-type N-terminal cleavage/methylation domain-containing protein